ncbi:hypothetical protein M406DRAFT_339700 [Cryphonectria parasitica EP155]|uniref:Membrane insertase YidC/Oxa/ALB C-terminal domain-containing protein n=1 Tax=Cryphonectria parasitica (strain ATCC 38755 / EP155) TaxID=660469 RepID=A0A9P4Y3Y6_CRYP1|nr:uncharacterized protein M406DRAFT_339700 [Cryphonectria parasitica EP155]KAF3766509.1 hypothetical protein M406DRAFT_339700 [Cryphonectria parasitica EP155]
MSGHVGHKIRLSALRIRPQVWQNSSGKCLHYHEPHSTLHPTTRLQRTGQRRHFGGADIAGGLLRGSEYLVTNIHELTGTPWFISIPLVALVVSAAIRTPLTLYTHHMARRRANLLPLIQAQTALIGLGLRKKAVPNLRDRVRQLMKKQTKDLFGVFAINQRNSILGGLLSLPIFLSNLEVIRRMCGGPRGLLGNLMFRSSNRDITTQEVTEATQPVPIPASSVDLSSSATDLSQATVSVSPDALASISMEPSFATGGCLWFPDLLVSDPYHVLPIAVSAVLVLHMIPETTAARRELFGLSPVAGDKNASLLGQTRGRRAFQRTMLIMALAIGPITMDMPAALHLYWLSSASFSLAVSKGIKVLLPIPKHTIKPCRGMEMPLLKPKPPTSRA